MPPIETLGFHFSKWSELSADIMIKRDKDFEKLGFPVDVYWMDILYTKQYDYFNFNPIKFPTERLEEMNR